MWEYEVQKLGSSENNSHVVCVQLKNVKSEERRHEAQNWCETEEKRKSESINF